MMTNYKKLKNGFSMAELLVALSIFALISTIGIGAFAFILRTQTTQRIVLENELIQEVKIFNCKKELFYQNQTPGFTPSCSSIRPECYLFLQITCP
jgi:prepilin-type N-terminal cleavage/methylation domain-containing protein